MDFGNFDHLYRNDLPLGEFYEQRLRMIEAYDAAGFYSYHLAEHHFTPLGMAPSPSVFLASIAQRTKRLRFGSRVYALPMHHPLSVFEEICMLDHLSNGRLDVGFGRGSVRRSRDAGLPASGAAERAGPRIGIRAARVPPIVRDVCRRTARSR
jgi:alkanesulfonate monooxygenase SsuD/methylene tetrahydromethanopterin reductase-like flavin-dependent oxidoreductase (luciferase family)